MHSAVRVLTLAAAVALPIFAHAQSASDAEAGKIEEGLVAILPKGLTKDGGLDVRASGDHYEVKLDLRNAIANAIAPWTVGDVTPIIQTLVAKDNGLWELTGKSSFKLATEFAAANRSNSMQLNIGEYDTRGSFDPAIGFLRDADIKFKDVLLNMRSGQDAIKIGTKDYTTKLGVRDVRPGVGDLTSDFTMTELTETFGGFPSPEVKIAGATLTGRQTFEGVDFAGIRKLIAFWQGSARGKTPAQLSETERTALAAIVAGHRPFVARAGEKTSIDNISISSSGKKFEVGKLTYHWSFEDLAKDGVIAAGVRLDQPKVDKGVWPAGLEQALPSVLSVNIRYHGVKLGPMWDLLSDPKTVGDASERTRDELSGTLLPDGRATMEFSDTYVRSANYELTVDGKILMRPGKRDDQAEADLNIRAKDFDKTVKFLQDNARTVPLFDRAAFFALMLKGLGKAEPGGSTLWNVKVDAMGHITINGQPLPV